MPSVRALLVSADPDVRANIGLAVRNAVRPGEPVELIEARDGVEGIALAWRRLPDVVVADEIASRAGGFAVALDLKGAVPPFTGVVVILLDRPQDRWLARWSGADAWFDKPVNPFELGDTVAALLEAGRKEAV
jgi:DNA-binding response OmpR family regulator